MTKITRAMQYVTYPLA